MSWLGAFYSGVAGGYAVSPVPAVPPPELSTDSPVYRYVADSPGSCSAPGCRTVYSVGDEVVLVGVSDANPRQLLCVDCYEKRSAA